MSNTTAAPAERASHSAPFTLTDLGMLLATIFWGTNITISKMSFDALPPMAFNALRFAIAPVLLAGITLLLERSLAIPKGMGWRIVWLGLTGHVLNQVFYSIGLNLSSASNSALLFAATPVVVALIGWARGTEHLSRAAWGGIGLSLAGVVLVLLARGLNISLSTLTGDLLIVVAVICWAIYTIGAGPLLAVCSPLRATALPMLAALPFMVLIGLPELLQLNWSTVGVAGWSGVLYSAIFSVTIAYWLWYSSVQQVGPTRTGIYTSLLPVAGIISAWIGLKEPIELIQILGAIAIFAGLWLTRRVGRETPLPATEPTT